MFLFQADNRLDTEAHWLTTEIIVNQQAEMLLSGERLDQRKLL